MNETMGQIIRRLRKNADLTQEELAEQLGITYQAVSRWENDTGMPDISQLVPLANVFDVPIDVLFGRVGQNSKEVDDFLAQMLWEDHHHEYAEGETFYDWWVGRYKKHRDMLAKYPNHVLLLYRTMSEGVFAVNNYADERNDEDRSPLTPEEYRTILEECVRWGDRIGIRKKSLSRFILPSAPNGWSGENSIPSVCIHVLWHAPNVFREWRQSNPENLSKTDLPSVRPVWAIWWASAVGQSSGSLLPKTAHNATVSARGAEATAGVFSSVRPDNLTQTGIFTFPILISALFWVTM